MIRPVDFSGPITPSAGRSTVRRKEGAQTFALPEETAEASGAAGAGEVVPLEAMLALQEAAGEPRTSSRDREAKERGRHMLALLRRLQAALLAPGGQAGSEGLLEKLAASLDGLPEAEDPSLQAALEAIALRVRIELARWRGR
jgi:hypothetical protein